MHRSSSRFITATLLAMPALVARAASAQGYQATVTISATVAEASAAPDAGLLSPRVALTAGAMRGARPAIGQSSRQPANPSPRPERGGEVVAPAVATPLAPVASAKYRVYVQLEDSTSAAAVVVRDAHGAEQRIVGGAAVVVGDSLTAGEAVRAPVELRVSGAASGDGSSVRLRYVVMPMESLTR